MIRRYTVSRASYWFGQQASGPNFTPGGTPEFVAKGVPRCIAMAIAPESEVRTVGLSIPSLGGWHRLDEGQILWVETKGGEMILRREYGGWTDGRLVLMFADTERDALSMPIGIAQVRRVRAHTLKANSSQLVYVDPGPYLTAPIAKASVAIRDGGTAPNCRFASLWRNVDNDAVEDTVNSGVTAGAAARTAITFPVAAHAYELIAFDTGAGGTSTDIDVDIAVQHGT